MKLLMSLLLVCTVNAVFADDENWNEITEVSCALAIDEATNNCALWDDPDTGDGDHIYDMVCFNKIMSDYGFSHEDYVLANENYSAKPGYNEFVCVEDLYQN